MRSRLAQRGLNVALRVGALGSRFVLIIVLAKLLPPADVGLFGLLTATISFSMLVLGGDYYTFAQRELLSSARERWSFVLQHQGLATLLLYVVLLPSQLFIIVWFGLLPASILGWFFVLLITEHVAQEINRILVAMQRPIVASWIFFVRIGAWVWFVVPFMWMRRNVVDIEPLLVGWAVGGVLAIVTGLGVIWREAKPWQRWSLDWAWLRRGFVVSLMFLFATMCFRALFTADRYLVEYLAGPELLGVYVLYAGIAMTAVNLLDPAVFSFLYPKVVRAYRQGDVHGYKKYMREMTWSALGFSIAIALGVIAVAPFVLRWLDRAIYVEDLRTLWILLGVSVVYSIGMVPHYGLYAAGGDRAIVTAHVSALLVFLLLCYTISMFTPHHAVPFALLAAFGWMGAFKLFAYLKVRKSDAAVFTVSL